MTRIDSRISVSTTAAGTAAGRRQQGFSMIEGLIAAALIGLVAVGIIPLFTRAMSDNMAGADYTRVTNYSKSKQEDFTRVPFSQPTIQVPLSQTSGVTLEYMDPAIGQWTTTVPSNPFAVWTRNTTLQQYNIHDIDDDLTFNFPLAGGSSPDETQILEATVKVASVSAIGPAGSHRTTTIRYLKAF